MLIGEVGLLTNDVVRLADFYKKILGVDNGSDDPVHQFVLSEGTALAIYNDGTVKNDLNENICLAFTVDDVDMEFEKLKLLRVPIIEEPATRPWGARNMHFLDPDGNHIYFRSFPNAEK